MIVAPTAADDAASAAVPASSASASASAAVGGLSLWLNALRLYAPRLAFLCALLIPLCMALFSTRDSGAVHASPASAADAHTVAIAVGSAAFYSIGILPLALIIGPRIWFDLVLAVVFAHALVTLRGEGDGGIESGDSLFDRPRSMLRLSLLQCVQDEPASASFPAADTNEHTIAPSPSSNASVDDLLSPFADAVALFFFTLRLFYASGHANDFSAIAFGAAFVGVDQHSMILSGALVTVHTFCGEWLAAWMLPLLALAAGAADETSAARSGDPSPSRHYVPSAAQWWLPLQFLICHACRVAFTTVNVLVQIRHLMLWALFAPKFVFDVGKCAATAASLLFAVSFLTCLSAARSRLCARKFVE
jgi:hypothetical protein